MRPGEELRKARKQAGLSQAKLATKAGVPQSTVARIETGSIDPRTSTLDKLLRVCSRRLQSEPLLGVGVDRGQIRRLLSLSPEQRINDAAAAAVNLSAFVGKLQKSKNG